MYLECFFTVRTLISKTSISPGLPWVAWVKLNHLLTGVRVLSVIMHKWGHAPTLNCCCGAAEQCTKNIILTLPADCIATGSNTDKN